MGILAALWAQAEATRRVINLSTTSSQTEDFRPENVWVVPGGGALR